MSFEHSLPRSTPEEQDVSSSAIIEFIETIEREAREKNNQELHSMMIVRHGYVVTEGWWAPYRPNLSHKMFSLSKSFTSTAIGLAIEEGKISLDDTVVSFFPEDTPAKIDDNLVSMRIKDLLTMSSGHDKDTLDRIYGCEDNNWVKAFLSLPVEHKPGTYFVYNSGASYMLSAILQKITGQTLLEYLEPRLFAPLGIKDARWDTCPKGINTGGFGLNIKTEDIAKLGQLFLQKGMWKGQRIISQAWVEDASSYHIKNGENSESDWEQGYCYQFWRCRYNNYRGDGAFGQFCIVLPEKDAVIALTGGIGFNHMQDILNHVWKYLLPAMSDTPPASDNSIQEALQRKCLSLEFTPPAINSRSSISAKISGTRFCLDPNPDNLDSISFAFNDDFCTITQWSLSGERHMNCGYSKWFVNRDVLPDSLSFHNAYGNWDGKREDISCGHTWLTALSGTWKDENTFVITQRFLETPFYYTITCCFNADELCMQTSANVSFRFEHRDPVYGKIVR